MTRTLIFAHDERMLNLSRTYRARSASGLLEARCSPAINSWIVGCSGNISNRKPSDRLAIVAIIGKVEYSPRRYPDFNR